MWPGKGTAGATLKEKLVKTSHCANPQPTWQQRPRARLRHPPLLLPLLCKEFKFFLFLINQSQNSKAFRLLFCNKQHVICQHHHILTLFVALVLIAHTGGVQNINCPHRHCSRHLSLPRGSLADRHPALQVPKQGCGGLGHRWNRNMWSNLGQTNQFFV